ncbi:MULTISPECIES: hypothetical protein [unclassified Bradyrhizobium]|nr:MULTISPECIES: hypothetical protein [unclassified Bradyrhizobium]MCK1540334.1 hypothetical protein [Bradyrhizobium sp. 176]MCK1556176.1 hypothetical protein [Bradyrhizobium sp. 171]
MTDTAAPVAGAMLFAPAARPGARRRAFVIDLIPSEIGEFSERGRDAA